MLFQFQESMEQKEENHDKRLNPWCCLESKSAKANKGKKKAKKKVAKKKKKVAKKKVVDKVAQAQQMLKWMKKM